MNNQIKELVDRLDPNKIKCQICKKWFDNTPHPYLKYRISKFDQNLCKKCYILSTEEKLVRIEIQTSVEKALSEAVKMEIQKNNK